MNICTILRRYCTQRNNFFLLKRYAHHKNFVATILYVSYSTVPYCFFNQYQKSADKDLHIFLLILTLLLCCLDIFG